jgi:hypothetical protein
MALSNKVFMSGCATASEQSVTFDKPIYTIDLLKNDAISSGSMLFGFGTGWASGSYLQLNPGDKIENFDLLEPVSTLYFYTALQSASPAWRLIATKERNPLV